MQETHLAEDDGSKHELEAINVELSGALEKSRSQVEILKQSMAELTNKLHTNNGQIQSLKDSCRSLELELKKERSKPAAAVPPPAAASGKSSAHL